MLRFHALKLTSRTAAAEDAVRLTLAVPQELKDAYAHAPGQHVALRVTLDGREQRRTCFCSRERRSSFCSSQPE
jgi:ring-1,2-phenylacetyl-CoA epoxidase subunit PaaE